MNITIDMGEVLIKAWKIIWKFKVLWIFGILAGCASNNGSSFANSFSNSFSRGAGQGDAFKQFQNLQPGEALRAFISQYVAIIVVVILLLCVLWFLFYFLGVMGKAGLIKGAGKADGGAEKLTFGELWSESRPYFWRMFGLAVLIGLPFFVITLALLVVFLVGMLGFVVNGGSNRDALAGLLAAMVIFFPGICCLGIIRLVVGMMEEQAQNAIVIEEKRVLEALSRGWNVFKTNFLTIFLIAVILGVASFIVNFIVSLPLVLVAVPMMAGTLIAGVNFGAALIPLAIAGGCLLVYLPIVLFVRGVAQSYTQSVWTLTYLRLTGPATAPAALETTDAP